MNKNADVAGGFNPVNPERYTLTWFKAADPWFGFPGKRHVCAMVETVTIIAPDQHMISRYCPCGGTEKWVSK